MKAIILLVLLQNAAFSSSFYEVEVCVIDAPQSSKLAVILEGLEESDEIELRTAPTYTVPERKWVEIPLLKEYVDDGRLISEGLIFQIAIIETELGIRFVATLTEKELKDFVEMETKMIPTYTTSSYNLRGNVSLDSRMLVEIDQQGLREARFIQLTIRETQPAAGINSVTPLRGSTP